MRRGRPIRDVQAPATRLAEASFPIRVVSGGHHPAFTAICEALARDLCAQHRTVEGAGHEVQLVTGEFNATLPELCGRAGTEIG